MSVSFAQKLYCFCAATVKCASASDYVFLLLRNVQLLINILSFLVFTKCAATSECIMFPYL